MLDENYEHVAVLPVGGDNDGSKEHQKFENLKLEK